MGEVLARTGGKGVRRVQNRPSVLKCDGYRPMGRKDGLLRNYAKTTLESKRVIAYGAPIRPVVFTPESHRYIFKLGSAF
jgi:hypothetical protein